MAIDSGGDEHLFSNDGKQEMAKVIRFHEYGGPEVLKIEEVDVPEPGRGEVRIKTEAIGIGFPEVWWRQNLYITLPNSFWFGL